jgi:large subunit ribosomal protein L17
MRHLREGRKLSRTAAHRRALLANLATALIEHERIETTLAKAKETRRVVERLITHAKAGKADRTKELHARRLVARTIRNPEAVTKLFDTLASWYATRPGGYTRVLRTRARLGDAGEMAILELVKTADQKALERKAREEAAKQKEEAKEKGALKAKEREAAKEKAEPKTEPRTKGAARLRSAAEGMRDRVKGKSAPTKAKSGIKERAQKKTRGGE